MSDDDEIYYDLGWDENPNPDFPDRPQHPDFWSMSEIARENDEVWIDRIEERFAQFADYESVRYLAINRTGFGLKELEDTGRIPEEITREDIHGVMSSGLMDGFLIGCAFMAKKLRRDFGGAKTPIVPSDIPVDGNRRRVHNNDD